MSWVQVIVLAILQGLTEFLPVSSSGTPGDRIARVLHRRRRRVVHRRHPAGDRGRGARVLRTRHRADHQGVVGRPVRGRAPHRRLLAGLVGHHRHDPDRCVRPVVQGRNPNGRTQSVADRDRVDRVLGGHRRSGVLRPPDAPRRTAHVEGQHHRRPGPVPGAGAGRIAIRRDDQRRAVSRDGPGTGRAVRLPARHPCGVRIGPVLSARRVSSGRRGDERQRSAVVGRDRDRLRRRTRGGRLVPALPGAPQHVLVRRLPRAARHGRARSCWALGWCRRYDGDPAPTRAVDVEHRWNAGRPQRGRRPGRQGARAGPGGRGADRHTADPRDRALAAAAMRTHGRTAGLPRSVWTRSSTIASPRSTTARGPAARSAIW